MFSSCYMQTGSWSDFNRQIAWVANAPKGTNTDDNAAVTYKI